MKSSNNNLTAIHQSNVRNDGLTPSQERAIEALLTARSIAAAARQAEVGESSLRRWVREDDNFQGLAEEALSHAALQLQQGVSKAVGPSTTSWSATNESSPDAPPSSAPPSNTASAPASTATSSSA